jgi:hypothetical protein
MEHKPSIKVSTAFHDAKSVPALGQKHLFLGKNDHKTSYNF